MPQKLTQATVNKLIGGLITEAGELTFPEEATIDELNCVLSRDGSRRRRKGLEILAGTSELGYSYKTTENRVYNYFVWKNAGGNPGLNFLVLQIGEDLRFYDLSIEPLNLGVKGFSVGLDSYLSPSFTTVGATSFTTIFGGLVVATKSTDTVYISYDFATDTIEVTPISFRVRDFEWQSNYDELPEAIPVTTVTSERIYDTYNAGWYGSSGGELALSQFIGTATANSPLVVLGIKDPEPPTTDNHYPPLTHPWYSARTASSFFSVNDWKFIQAASSVTANGLFKLDFFNQDRGAVSGLSDLPVKIENNRFSAVATFAGRVWYAGLASGANSGKVLFSQVVINASPENALSVLGQCLQTNDPTSEYTSDILDTDGGVIDIPEAVEIKRLHAYNNSLFVFASNGVWVVSGVDDRFSPTAYTVNKISTVGIDSPLSFISAEGIPFWWSQDSINTVSFDESSGFPVQQDLSIGTIQTFFNEIGSSARSQVFADYDAFNKKLFWWYPDEDGESYEKNNALILDIPLKAFYPWKAAGSSGKFVVGTFYKGPSSTRTISEVVTDAALAEVTVGADPVTVSSIIEANTVGTELIVLYLSTSPNRFRFGTFSSNTYLDFETNSYDTYFETGYFFAGDLLIKKTSPLITVYLRSTEEGFTGNETDGYNAINPSGLILKSYWDFKYESSSSQQAYRIKPFTMVNPVALDNSQQKSSVVITRLKVRGRGRSMRLRFEAEAGKDFVFLGYSVLVGINDRF